MHIGSRNVRSAGRGSGSVEITLPVGLSVLEGVTCHLELRDSLAPEILLRPDVGFLLPVFDMVWERVALGLEGIDEIGAFSESDYVVGLFPERSHHGRPGLAYEDALRVHRDPTGGLKAPRNYPLRRLESFARLIEAMVTVAGKRLGLSAGIAVLFGDQVAHAATGAPLAAVDAFARSSLSAESGKVGWCRPDPFDEACWRAARPRLERLYDRLADWDVNRAVLERERASWYRAHRIEARTSTVEPW